MSFFTRDKYSDEYEDSGSMAISGAMKEELKRESKEAQLSLFSHWNEDEDNDED